MLSLFLEENDFTCDSLEGVLVKRNIAVEEAILAVFYFSKIQLFTPPNENRVSVT
jgi:hypothetical protein